MRCPCWEGWRIDGLMMNRKEIREDNNSEANFDADSGIFRFDSFWSGWESHKFGKRRDETTIGMRPINWTSSFPIP